MSFWFYGRRRRGMRTLWSINVSVILLITLLALAIGLLLPLFAWLLGD